MELEKEVERRMDGEEDEFRASRHEGERHRETSRHRGGKSPDDKVKAHNVDEDEAALTDEEPRPEPF